MRRTLLFLALAAAPAAHAQIVSIYGTYSPLHASNVATGSIANPPAPGTSFSSGYTEQYTSFFTSGFGGGVTLGALPLGPIHLGFDLRGSTKPGTVGADTAFAGIRLGFKPPLLPIKPYVQASGGYVSTRTFNTTTTFPGGAPIGGTFTNKYAAYLIAAGVDYKLAPFFDLRLIEVGVGQALDVLGGSSAPNATILTLNTGLVFHF